MTTATTASQTTASPSTAPIEDCVLLKKANKKIADLKQDIRRLSDELKKKDSLKSSQVKFICIAHFMYKTIQSALQK